MPNLSFEILSARPARDMMAPGVVFDIRVTNAFPEQRIDAVLLRCQLVIDVARRRYDPVDQAKLTELFDRPERWGETLRPITWMNASINVPGFTGTTTFPLIAPCSYDFTVAASKYFHGLEAGEAPLSFLFSGTVFFTALSGQALQAVPISWDKEARFRLPVDTWKRVIDLYYPNAAFLHLRRDIFEELYRYKVSAGLATFDEALEKMLAIAVRERPAS
jgi:hypothetical protein